MSYTISDVVIVGAGPAGLTLATALATRGIGALVIDRQAVGANTSRAAVVHARTLEVLEPLDVANRLVNCGVQIPRFTIRDRDRILVPVDFDHLPTQYPYTLMVSQAVTEAMLRERFRELGGNILWSRTVTDVTQDDHGVTATLDDGQQVRTRYLVGADGMHSTIREHASIGFPGARYGESFSLADVHLTKGVLPNEVILYFSPAGLVVVAPLPNDIYRIVATVASAPEQPDVSFVQALLDARGPERGKVVVNDVIWGSRFFVHHRVATTYRANRILLVGDAAHVHSPAGGQGMNTGIQDGAVLAEALAATLTSGDQTPLDTYGAVRRPVAKQVVGLADQLTRMATVGQHLRPLRNATLSMLATIPAFRRSLAWRLSGLAYR